MPNRAEVILKVLEAISGGGATFFSRMAEKEEKDEEKARQAERDALDKRRIEEAIASAQADRERATRAEGREGIDRLASMIGAEDENTLAQIGKTVQLSPTQQLTLPAPLPGTPIASERLVRDSQGVARMKGGPGEGLQTETVPGMRASSGVNLGNSDVASAMKFVRSTYDTSSFSEGDILTQASSIARLGRKEEARQDDRSIARMFEGSRAQAAGALAARLGSDASSAEELLSDESYTAYIEHEKTMRGLDEDTARANLERLRASTALAYRQLRDMDKDKSEQGMKQVYDLVENRAMRIMRERGESDLRTAIQLATEELAAEAPSDFLSNAISMAGVQLFDGTRVDPSEEEEDKDPTSMSGIYERINNLFGQPGSTPGTRGSFSPDATAGTAQRPGIPGPETTYYRGPRWEPNR